MSVTLVKEIEKVNGKINVNSEYSYMYDLKGIPFSKATKVNS